MQSVHMAAGAIALGAGEVFICAGVESMSRVPMGGYNPMPNPDLAKGPPGAYMNMGETAENIARQYQITRADQEAFAVASQRKAARHAPRGGSRARSCRSPPRPAWWKRMVASGPKPAPRGSPR